MISQLAFAKKGYLWRNMQNVAKRRTLPGKIFNNGYEKRESLAHRTATTSYPCCLPALGGFRGSWSCTTFPAANIVFLCRSANYPEKYARFSGNSSLQEMAHCFSLKLSKIKGRISSTFSNFQILEAPTMITAIFLFPRV